MATHVSNIIYGGIDGTITTFAVMTGAIGMGLPTATTVILALSNVFADGFSMGVSAYESVILAAPYAGIIETPLIKAAVTFGAFIIIGSIPPLLYYAYSDADLKLYITISITILLLLFIGMLKGYMEDGADMNTMLGRGVQTAVLGSIAGAIAYAVTISMSGILIKK